MTAKYSTGQGDYTYEHGYESVSWRYLIQDVTNINNNYLVNEHVQEPNIAMILAGRDQHNYKDTGTSYQMWPTKFEILSYVPYFTIHGDGVPHYYHVRTAYRCFWAEKKWEVTGAPNEEVPAFDHIPSSDEVVELFIKGLHAAGISPLGGSRALKLGDSEGKELEVEDFMADYVGTLRPADKSAKF